MKESFASMYFLLFDSEIYVTDEEAPAQTHWLQPKRSFRKHSGHSQCLTLTLKFLPSHQCHLKPRKG